MFPRRTLATLLTLAVALSVIGCAKSSPLVTAQAAPPPVPPGVIAFSGTPTISPVTPISGNLVTVTFTIQNLTATPVNNVSWTVAEDSIAGYTSGTITTILANSTASVSFTAQHLTSTHVYTIAYDPFNLITTESGNSYPLSITWAAPGTLGVSIAFATNSGVVGASNIIFSINNSGATPQTIYFRVVDQTLSTVMTPSILITGQILVNNLSTTAPFTAPIANGRETDTFRIEVSTDSTFTTLSDETVLVRYSV